MDVDTVTVAESTAPAVDTDVADNVDAAAEPKTDSDVEVAPLVIDEIPKSGDAVSEPSESLTSDVTASSPPPAIVDGDTPNSPAVNVESRHDVNDPESAPPETATEASAAPEVVEIPEIVSSVNNFGACENSVSSDGMSTPGLQESTGRNSSCGQLINSEASSPLSARNFGSKSRRKSDRILPTSNDDGQDTFQCPVCSEMLPSNHELTKHIRSHNNVVPSGTANVSPMANTCTICAKVLSSQSSLDRHMLVHSGERPFECSLCKMAFTTNGNMHRHMRIHDKESAMSGDNGDGSLSPLMTSQGRTPRGKKRYVTSASSSHSDDGASETGAFSAGIPGIKRKLLSSDFASYSRHPAAKRITFDREVVDRTNSDVDDLDQDSANAGMKCPACNASFITAYGLGTHIETHHDKQIKATTVVVCPHCKVQFRGLDKLDDHIWQYHSRIISELDSLDGVSVFSDGDSSRKSPAVGKSSAAAAQAMQPSAISFSDILSVVEFSSKKFGLLSPMLNERSPARRAHNSKLTSPATPARNFNGGGELRKCPKCDQSFSSRLQCSKHVTECHDTATVVHEFSSTSTSCDPRENSLAVEEFALVLGLTASPDRSSTSSSSCDQSTPERSSIPAKKFPVVDANRNLVKPELSPMLQSVAAAANGQSNSMVFGPLVPVALPGPAVMQCNIFQLRPQISMLQQPKSIHHAFGLAQPSAFEQPILMAAAGSALQAMSTSMLSPALSSVTGSIPAIELLRKSTEAMKTEQAKSVSVSPSGSSSLDCAMNDSNNMEAKTESSEKDDQSKTGSYNCTICSESFISYRAYRGHMASAHHGSSPYKCNQCAYASADRSTLIRHLRTHNGERPFQCRKCDFAFTTKANCERHIRKKHEVENKDDMEASIGYNRSSKDTQLGLNSDMNMLENPQKGAVSTVCKYCGVDFKFYRTLKHHLRSQTSCAHKPFTCRGCRIGFSTKANCLRHIQKRHGAQTMGSSASAEAMISVNETILAAQQQQLASPAAATSSNGLSAIMKRGHCETLVSAEPLLNKQLKLESNDLNAGLKGAAYGKVKTEVVTSNASYDQPLDFSLKSTANQKMQSTSGQSDGSYSADQPMDLSVGSRHKAVDHLANRPVTVVAHDEDIDAGAPLSLVLPTKRQATESATSSTTPLAHQFASGVVSVAHRPTGTAALSTALAALTPSAKYWRCPHCCAQFKSSNKLTSHIRSHVTDVRHSCHLCLAKFKCKADLDRHLKVTHSQFADSNNNSITSGDNSPVVATLSGVEPNNNIQKVVNANVRTLELPKSVHASVTTTPTVIASELESDMSSSSALLNSNSDAAKLPTLSGANSGKSVVFGSTSDLSSSVSNQDTNHAVAVELDVKHNESDLTDEVATSSASQSVDYDGSDMSMKRKRNSYADSPHKLRCPYCPRAFPWISSLKRHILTHTGQKPFRCPQCPVTFSTKSNRERHMIRKHGLDVHDPATRQMMDRPYKCHLCIFSSFATSGKLMRHYKTKHSDRELPDNLLASVSTMSQDELNAALSKLGAKTNCGSDSNHAFGSALNLSGEAQDSDDTQDFDNEDDSDDEDDDERAVEAEVEAVVRSVVRVPTSRVTSPGPVAAGRPGSIGLRSVDGQVPISSDSAAVSRKASNVNPERDNYNVDRITECWQCNRSFDCRKSLLRHLKEHGVDLSFKCYLCDASFASRAASLSHKAAAHASDWSLLRDKNRVGTDIADYADFIDSVVQDALTGGTSAPVTARRMRDGVELDIRLESDYAQRKVYCSLCPKRFWSLQDLRRHMRSHTGERPFECDVCHARFTLKHSMMRHRRKHEGAEAGDIGSDSDEESMEESGSRRISMAAVAAASLDGSNLVGSPYSQVTLPDLIQSMPQRPSPADGVKLPAHSVINTGAVSSPGSHSDLLQNLLGVSDSAAIDRMLDSAVEGAAGRLVANTDYQHFDSPIIAAVSNAEFH